MSARPGYLGSSERNPSALKLWITSCTRSSLVNATFAIAATSIPWADSNTICARRQVTTDPLPRRDDPQQTPSLVVIDLTHPQAFGHRPPVSGIGSRRKGAQPDNVTCYGTSGEVGTEHRSASPDGR